MLRWLVARLQILLLSLWEAQAPRLWPCWPWGAAGMTESWHLPMAFQVLKPGGRSNVSSTSFYLGSV